MTTTTQDAPIGCLPDLGRRTLVMGILNITPDSFSDGGLFNAREAAETHADSLQAEGADIVDIGGESTRPGHTPVPAEEEHRRAAAASAGARRRRRGSARRAPSQRRRRPPAARGRARRS